ncbi:hypothetical protein GCM10010317_037380 [Streptomyces mirabilis]|uniref:sulfotransferase n=1 Tax=Streptomyces mirabilis TaxID=68239 RepID=UPI0019BF7560|nr:sulfotransferase [Streptomyces mirabilis]GHD53924.1 hypothetical protein GCM10010317_037380 [Streptomyces mirabilis]
MAERITDGPPTLGSALGSALGIALRAYAEEHGKVRRGDKRPAYALHVAEIQRLFPDAQFVHLVRDGRGCVASLLRMQRTGPSAHPRRTGHPPVGTWTARLTSDQIRLSEAVLGERLTSYGYELAGVVRPDPAELPCYRRVEVPRRAAHAKRRALDHLARVRAPGPVACRPATG